MCDTTNLRRLARRLEDERDAARRDVDAMINTVVPLLELDDDDLVPGLDLCVACAHVGHDTCSMTDQGCRCCDETWSREP